MESTVKRPTTCGALHRSLVTSNHPDADSVSAVGCKRLPRHTGEHRATLTVAAGRRALRAATKPTARKSTRTHKTTLAEIKALVTSIREGAGAVGRKRLTAAQRRVAFGNLATMVESGSVTSSAALGIAAKLA